MTNAKTDELWALTYAFANEAGICERSDKWHREEPCETCQGLVNYARRVVTVLTDAAVNWEASYHRACDDADAYKVETERRIAKIEQNWRSCQHEVEYLRAALVEHKKAKREASVSPPSEGWLPIATYPDDGSDAVVWNGQPWRGYFQEPDGWFADVDGELLRIDPPPTFWIPAPPASAGTEEP